MCTIAVFRQWFLVFFFACVLVLSPASAVQATVMFYDDLGIWQTAISGSGELFATTWVNVVKADEFQPPESPPSDPTDAQLGSTLTFDMANTGLSRGFVLNTLQAGAGFTFNEREPQFGDNPIPGGDFEEALSVGDLNDLNNLEDDDWSVSILNGSFITAFGVEFRHARFPNESPIILKAGDAEVGRINLSDFLPLDGNGNFFVGITSTVPFDRLEHDHQSLGDDIALADIRFGAVVVPEPASAILFLTGISGLGILRHRSKGRE